MTNSKRDALIIKWQESQTLLAEAKEREAELRKQVLTEVFNFSENDLREGVENFELGKGFKLKATFKVNRTLDNTNDKVDSILTKMENTSEEGRILAERLVKWKAELSVSEYRNLPDKFKKMIDAAITTKTATPSLTFVEPKSK